MKLSHNLESESVRELKPPAYRIARTRWVSRFWSGVSAVQGWFEQGRRGSSAASVSEPIKDDPFAVDDPVDTLRERFLLVLWLLLAHGIVFALRHV